MVTFQRLSFLTSGTAAALLISLPAQANEISTPQLRMADTVDTTAISLEAEQPAVSPEATAVEMRHVFAGESNWVTDTAIEESTLEETIAEPTSAPLAESNREVEPVAAQTLDDYLTESAPLAEGSLKTSADSVLGDAAIADFSTTDVPAIAQAAPPPAARGVAPYYVGIGGNIGIIDSDESAIGDFGFSIISKFSLGPRFALRPTLLFSEDDFSVALPVTYNFNPVDFRRFSIYPSAGVGIDISDGVGLLLNGGIDLPISREFTLNSQLNWRVTDDAGLGLLLGVGYNFQTIFD